MSDRESPMLHGEHVYRIYWQLGTDIQRAVCHCSAERSFEDPAEAWEWLLAHPTGHDAPEAGIGGPVPTRLVGAPS
jgi:hypothetical protein